MLGEPRRDTTDEHLHLGASPEEVSRAYRRFGVGSEGDLTLRLDLALWSDAFGFDNFIRE